MNRRRLSLGLDLSTQSLSAVVLEMDTGRTAASLSLNYIKDKRLQGFGIRESDYILPPRITGEADQPPMLFLAALDAMFSDLSAVIDMADIGCINASAQQHGHVYLNASAGSCLESLKTNDAGQHDLITHLKEMFAYERAPVWMTSCTAKEAAFIRKKAGGKEELIRLTGSDAQLRFTGTVVRHVGERFPQTYRDTATIHLLSSLISAVLTGNIKAPIDYGNACGMSLMNYTTRTWDDACLKSAADGLLGGYDSLQKKLPTLAAPDSIVGTICSYFGNKYGFADDCMVAACSGDNPQSKVMVSGDLLSLGSSFVNMVATDGKSLDMTGAASAMYDGLGRPFMFGCRTNGALVWDQVRLMYGLGRENYEPAEEALQQASVGGKLVLWQLRTESFPVSGSFDVWREDREVAELSSDYAGCIESSLAAVYCHSRSFAKETGEPLCVTGGAASSPGIMRRIAAIWNRPVIRLEKMGAALGAAVAGVAALHKKNGDTFDAEDFVSTIHQQGMLTNPLSEDIAAFHKPGGYLDRFMRAESDLMSRYPLS